MQGFTLWAKTQAPEAETWENHSLSFRKSQANNTKVGSNLAKTVFSSPTQVHFQRHVELINRKLVIQKDNHQVETFYISYYKKHN